MKTVSLVFCLLPDIIPHDKLKTNSLFTIYFSVSARVRLNATVFCPQRVDVVNDNWVQSPFLLHARFSLCADGVPQHGNNGHNVR